MAYLVSGARFCGQVLVLIVLASTSFQLGAQQGGPSNAWDRLMEAPPGSRVKITLSSGVVRGRIVAVGADTVVITDVQTGANGIGVPASGWTGDRLTLPRAEVTAIDVASRARNGEPGFRAGTFEQLSPWLRPGDRVVVTDVAGTRHAGRITEMASSALSMQVGQQRREFRERDVFVVTQRRSDSVANGALWGLGIGAGTGMLTCGTCHVGPGLMTAAVFGGIGAGIGVGVDALIKSDFIIFQRREPSAPRVSIAPQFSKSHKSVSVTLGF